MEITAPTISDFKAAEARLDEKHKLKWEANGWSWALRKEWPLSNPDMHASQGLWWHERTVLQRQFFGDLGNPAVAKRSKAHLWAYINASMGGLEWYRRTAISSEARDNGEVVVAVVEALKSLGVRWQDKHKCLESPGLAKGRLIGELKEIGQHLEDDERDELASIRNQSGMNDETSKPSAKAKNPKRRGRPKATMADREAKSKADRKLIEEWEASGLTKAAFCKREGLKPCGKSTNAVTRAQSCERRRRLQREKAGRTKLPVKSN